MIIWGGNFFEKKLYPPHTPPFQKTFNLRFAIFAHAKTSKRVIKSFERERLRGHTNGVFNKFRLAPLKIPLSSST